MNKLGKLYYTAHTYIVASSIVADALHMRTVKEGCSVGRDTYEELKVK
jgi:hypothetical protein